MRQWLRMCKLLLVDKMGQGLDVSEFHIIFKIKKADIETPNSAEIKIYNLRPETIARVQKEFTSVILQAGYEENFGVIFKGDIWQFIKGKENGVDTFLTIIAGDGDKAFNFAVVSKSLAAGSGFEEQIQACSESMGKFEITKGFQAVMPLEKLPRGKIMFGMARGFLTGVANSTETGWSIQDGELQFIKKDSYLPNAAVPLNSKTGLIGRPQQTMEGLLVKCLLNSKLRVGSRVQINESSFDLLPLAVKYKEHYKVQIAPKLNANGFYRILAIEYDGDTRGQSWYCDLICVGIDQSAPIGSKVIDTGAGRVI